MGNNTEKELLKKSKKYKRKESGYKKLLKWIRVKSIWIEHDKYVTVPVWLLVSITIVFFIFIIPYAIHFAFINDAPISSLEARWGSGDILAFYGAILSLVGTMLFSWLAIRQNDELNKTNKMLQEREQRRERGVLMPLKRQPNDHSDFIYAPIAVHKVVSVNWKDEFMQNIIASGKGKVSHSIVVHLAVQNVSNFIMFDVDCLGAIYENSIVDPLKCRKNRVIAPEMHMEFTCEFPVEEYQDNFTTDIYFKFKNSADYTFYQQLTLEFERLRKIGKSRVTKVKLEDKNYFPYNPDGVAKDIQVKFVELHEIPNNLHYNSH